MFSLLQYPRSAPLRAVGSVLSNGRTPAMARVCLVTDTGLPAVGALPGEAGESVPALADWLRLSGCATTVLDLAIAPVQAAPGIDYVHLRTVFPAPPESLPAASLCAYYWLKSQDFDLILFGRGFGAGYYSAVAKGLGIAFAGTTMAVLTDDSHAYRLERMRQFPEGRTDIERDFLERQTVCRADLLITADPAFAEWCTKAGWQLPPHCLLWPGGQQDGTEPFAPDIGELIQCRSRDPHGDPYFSHLEHPPLVSVCMPTYNRPTQLREAIESLLRQTYAHFELILVDDGSTDPAVTACLAELAPVFDARGWTVVRQENAGPSIARRTAVAQASGEYLLFMDDDNVALNYEIERFVAAAIGSDADVITCIPGRHPDSDMGPPAVAELPTPDPDHPVCGVDWTPVGASLALCAMNNCLGDNNALYKRSVFIALGGFQGGRRFVFEDVQLLTRAVARGYRLEVLPEILFLYRRHRDSRSMRDDVFAGHVECLTPLTELIPRDLWPLLLTAHRDWYEGHRLCATGNPAP